MPRDTKSAKNTEVGFNTRQNQEQGKGRESSYLSVLALSDVITNKAANKPPQPFLNDITDFALS